MTKNFYQKAIKAEIALIFFLLVFLLTLVSWSIMRQRLSQQNLQASTQASQTETGFASYYDDAFHGQPTSSGEPYDKNELTAAHRKYPFGTLVRVTNLDNGKSVVVRVNDRGPHKKERIIDISGRAARKLELVRMGVAKVKLEVVE